MIGAIENTAVKTVAGYIARTMTCDSERMLASHGACEDRPNVKSRSSDSARVVRSFAEFVKWSGRYFVA